MVSVILSCDIDEKDLLIAELYERATTGIVEREELGGECWLEAFFDTADEAQPVIDALAAHRPILLDHGTKDYVQEFQNHWQPQPIGRRLWLAPPWHPGPPPGDRLRVNYQPGMACGSGAHPCTRLCLEALEEARPAGVRVADIGAGSGILLLAAQALGAGRVTGCDIDHSSVVIAKENVHGALLYTGSARSLRTASFDIVIANISAEAIETLRDELRRIAAPDARLILSGFRTNDLPTAFKGQIHQLEGWACIRL